MSRVAWAQAYPTRPVRIIVGFPAGGAPDIIARLMGQWLSERLGQPFVIENRPGAASNIGTEVGRESAAGRLHAPRGRSRQTRSTRRSTTNLNFNFIRDIAPVASITAHALCAWWSIHRFRPRPFPSSSPMPKPIRARSTWPRPAAEATSHVAGELFKMMTGVDIGPRAVSWRAPALTDLLGGQVQVAFRLRCLHRLNTSRQVSCAPLQ